MAFVINRNNEVTGYLKFLKEKYKTSNNTTAIYRAIDDFVTFHIPEFERLKEVETKYNNLVKNLTMQENLANSQKELINN